MFIVLLLILFSLFSYFNVIFVHYSSVGVFHMIIIIIIIIERGRARLNCCHVSSLSWLGKTLCPPNCLVKSDIKAPSCAAIFRLGIVVL